MAKYDKKLLCDFCWITVKKSLHHKEREVYKRKQIKDLHVSLTLFRKTREVSFDG